MAQSVHIQQGQAASSFSKWLLPCLLAQSCICTGHLHGHNSAVFAQRAQPCIVCLLIVSQVLLNVGIPSVRTRYGPVQHGNSCRYYVEMRLMVE